MAFFISDLHLSNRLPFARFVDEIARPEGQELVTDRLLEAKGEALRQCFASEEETIVITGDLFDRRTANGTELFVVIDLLRTLIQADRKIVIIGGNHCADGHDAQSYLIDGLNGFEDRVTTIKSGIVGIDGEEVWAMSYRSDRRAMEFIQTIPDGAPLIMHQTVKGAYIGSYTFPIGIRQDDLARLGAIISGHLHSPQEWLPGQQRYVGAHIQHSFEDAFDDRGGWVFRLTDGQIDGSKTRRIPFQGRKFHVFRVTSEAQAQERAAAIANGDFLRLIFQGTVSDIQRTRRWREEWAGLEMKTTGKTILWEEAVISESRSAQYTDLSRPKIGAPETRAARDEQILSAYIGSCDVTGKNTASLKEAGLLALSSAERE